MANSPGTVGQINHHGIGPKPSQGAAVDGRGPAQQGPRPSTGRALRAGNTGEQLSKLAAPEGEGAAPAQLLSQPQGRTAALSKLALSCIAEFQG